ncbi:MAG: hypothetical protein Q9192_000234 [Flavoplaca navasiana]
MSLYHYDFFYLTKTNGFFDSNLNASYHRNSNNNLSHKVGPTFYARDPRNYNCIAAGKGVHSRGFLGDNFTRKGRRMGTYRTPADVAEATQEDLGDNICAYSEKGFESAARRSGPLKYYVDKGDERNKTHIRLSPKHTEKAKLEHDKEYG